MQRWRAWRHADPLTHSFCSVLGIQPPEFLHALAGIHLGSEDVSLPVNGDVMQRSELADLTSRPPETAQGFLCGMVENAHLAVHAVDHVDELLLPIGREDEIIDGSGAPRRFLVDVLGHEASILAEDLHAIVAAVTNVDQTFAVDADAMHRVAELLRRRLRRIIGRHLFIAWLFCHRRPNAACRRRSRNRIPPPGGWHSHRPRTLPWPPHRRPRRRASRAARWSCCHGPRPACRSAARTCRPW